MEHQYIEHLPAKIKEMVVEIEALTGTEIATRYRTDEDLVIMPDKSVAQLDCRMEEGVTTVTIALPTEGYPAHFIIHEIIHAHRILVNEVPYLKAATNGVITARVASRIENDIEHLFVIPMEITYAPEAKQHWKSYYDRLLEELKKTSEMPTLTELDLIFFRETLLRTWLVVSTVIPEWKGIAELASMLTFYGWLGDAVNLVKKINRVKSRKARCVSASLRFFRFDPTHYRLCQFSMSEGKNIQLPMPVD